ncbi:MAG: IS5 family transposase [Leptolyngbya sp. BL-A-14]
MTNKPSECPTLWRVPDTLWAQIAPTLVVNKPRQKPGRPRAADRPIFDALIYLARTGMQWAVLPQAFPPKSTVHDRLQEWVEYGCLEAAWALLLAAYDETLGLEWQWQVADGCIVKAPLGKRTAEGDAQATGANPTDRSKSGCKRHRLTDGKGIPLAVVLSGANRHDMKKLANLLDAKVLAAPTPETSKQHLCLDRGYDYEECRQAAQQRGYIPHIPDKEAPLPAPTDPHRHPPRRWVVEVGHAWFNRFRGVLIRWAKSSQSYLGFVQIAACLIVGRKLLSFSG